MSTNNISPISTKDDTIKAGIQMKKHKYCCIRFQESVEEKIIIKAEGYDETEWYFNNGPHLYFCPFCGKSIKGNGYGEYDKKSQI